MLRRRLSPLAALGLVAVIVAGCSSSSNSAETTLSPQATPWRTLPPVSATDAPTSIANAVGAISYTVRVGDYANGIAAKAGGVCSGADILSFNNITSLYPGEVIKISGACLAPGVTADVLNAIGASGPGGSPVTTSLTEYVLYIVVKGDYWLAIARKTGCKTSELINANPGVSVLLPGEKLRVPMTCTPPATVTSTTVKKKTN
jgi:LysM repeat protein